MRFKTIFSRNTKSKTPRKATKIGNQRVRSEKITATEFSKVEKKAFPKPLVNLVEASRRSPVPA